MVVEGGGYMSAVVGGWGVETAVESYGSVVVVVVEGRGYRSLCVWPVGGRGGRNGSRKLWVCGGGGGGKGL